LSAQLTSERVPSRPYLQGLELVLSLLIVFALSVAVWWLTKVFPNLFTGNLKRTLQTIEFPVYAIILGFAARAILSLLDCKSGWRLASALNFF